MLIQNKRKLIFDIEATGLLNSASIDYSKMPYTLKPDFRVHCIVLRDIETNEVFCFYDGEKIILDGREYRCPAYHRNGVKAGERKEQDQVISGYEPIKYVHFPMDHIHSWLANNASMLGGHNIINYDLLALFLYCRDHPTVKFNYTIEPDTLNGNKIFFHDTLVLSRMLDPDLFGGHSLDNLAKKAGGSQKFEYEGSFAEFSPVMLYYCIKDVIANHYVYNYLRDRALGWDWKWAYSTEKKVAYIVTNQEHYGFDFDQDLAKWCADDLNKKIADIEARVEPILPPKKIGKTSAKEFIPPKSQFKQNGEISTHFQNFLDRHKGVIVESEEEEVGVRVKKTIIRPRKVKIYDKIWTLPLEADKPIVETEPMLLGNQEDIKEYLIRQGWDPTNWKDKDLTLGEGKKKLTREKFEAAVERYVESTLDTAFARFRCEHIKTTPAKLREQLLKHNLAKPLKVLTLPKFSINIEKDLCPNLVKLGQRVEYVTDIVHWLTYRHRRNCILSPNDTGWLKEPRLQVDGRIPTPANPCGAATARFTHISVANIPRNSSLYGEYMRALFRVAGSDLQLGYDASSLEARIEGHYIYKYEGGIELGESLLASKPNDIHTLSAKRFGLHRDEAKSVNYALAYGCHIHKLMKMLSVSYARAEQIFNEYWALNAPLKEFKDDCTTEWESNLKSYVVGIDGRKLMTRSKHSLVNIKIQSAGIIAMKIAMVWLHNELEKKGILGNPFVEDVNKRLCTVQMIAYHDECQNRISRGLVEDFKTFKTKEEAAAYKAQRESETKRIYSTVGHVKDKYYVGYCVVGDLAVQSIIEAGRQLKLKVPLAGEYNLGKNWRDCH